jgi:hypothetical protein
MTPRELHLWAALWNISPWSEERADLRTAMVSCMIAETRRDPRKRSTPFTPREFLPYAAERARALSKRVKEIFQRFKRS